TWDGWLRSHEGDAGEPSDLEVVASDEPLPWPDFSCLHNDTWDNGSLDDIPEERWRHVAVWTGTQMLIWGGLNDLSDYLGNGGRYDPLTDTWTPMTTSGAPAPRSFATAVWTGEEMLIWGGEGEGDTFPAAGGRYDPATDTWSPMSTAGQPSGRMD